MRLFISGMQSAYNKQSGVALSFDDSSRMDSWINYHNDFGITTNWKATFYVYIREAIISELQTFDTYGHEIANHTKNHYNGVNDYMLTHTAEEYYLEYLKPMDDWVVANGMNKPETFRFPYNYINDEVKDYLINNDLYKIVTPGYNDLTDQYPIPEKSINIYDNIPLNYQWALSLGRHRDGYNEQVFIDLLTYARDNNKIVMFYGHSIGESTWSIAITEWSLMSKISDFINSNGMKFYTMKELVNLIP